MILFRLSESDGSTENQFNADMELVQQMLEVMELQHINIVNVTRLGKPDSGSTMRPLRVQFQCFIDRETVVRNGHYLAGSEEFRAVGVSRDLIMADRIISRNNYLMKKQQNQQNDARTITSEETAPNTVEEAPAEASIESETVTREITDSAATGEGDQAHPQLTGETSVP